jgi:ketosteroid isomerase-like protein
MDARRPFEARAGYAFDDESNVEEVNDRFYRAIEEGDLSAMEEIWLHEDWVKCVHPGWELIVGWEGVRESWRKIFENTSGMRISASCPRAVVEGDFAWLICTENLVIFLDHSSAPVSAATVATNLFFRHGSEWRMIHHHASPTPSSDVIAASETIQ